MDGEKNVITRPVTQMASGCNRSVTVQVLSPPSATSATALTLFLYGSLEAEHSQLAPSREGKGLVKFLLVVLNHLSFLIQ